MKTFTVVFVSKNAQWAILSHKVAVVVGNKTLTVEHSGWLSCQEGWEKGETIELPNYKVGERKSKDGAIFKVIELV